MAGQEVPGLPIYPNPILALPRALPTSSLASYPHNHIQAVAKCCQLFLFCPSLSPPKTLPPSPPSLTWSTALTSYSLFILSTPSGHASLAALPTLSPLTPAVLSACDCHSTSLSRHPRPHEGPSAHWPTGALRPGWPGADST